MPRSLGPTTLQILAAIRDGVAYGLDIVAHTGLKSGTVYPTLGRLAKADLVKSRWEAPERAEAEGRPRRRYYELTAEGEAKLAEGVERVTSLAAGLRRGLEGGR